MNHHALAYGLLALAPLAVLARWYLRRPPPVVGRRLPFPNPKRRKRFESWLNH